MTSHVALCLSAQPHRVSTLSPGNHSRESVQGVVNPENRVGGDGTLLDPKNVILFHHFTF